MPIEMPPIFLNRSRAIPLGAIFEKSGLGIIEAEPGKLTSPEPRFSQYAFCFLASLFEADDRMATEGDPLAFCAMNEYERLFSALGNPNAKSGKPPILVRDLTTLWRLERADRNIGQLDLWHS
jgi:hypothetical protein